VVLHHCFCLLCLQLSSIDRIIKKRGKPKKIIFLYFKKISRYIWKEKPKQRKIKKINKMFTFRIKYSHLAFHQQQRLSTCPFLSSSRELQKNKSSNKWTFIKQWNKMGHLSFFWINNDHKSTLSKRFPIKYGPLHPLLDFLTTGFKVNLSSNFLKQLFNHFLNQWEYFSNTRFPQRITQNFHKIVKVVFKHSYLNWFIIIISCLNILSLKTILWL
jgi:hypothetical protein